MNTIRTKDGTEMYQTDRVPGHPVGFNHGWPLSTGAWESQGTHWATNGYRCIAHDCRGHATKHSVKAVLVGAVTPLAASVTQRKST